MKLEKLKQQAQDIIEQIYKEQKDAFKSIQYRIDFIEFQARTDDEYSDWKELLPKEGRSIEVVESEGAETIAIELSQPIDTSCGLIKLMIINEAAGNSVYDKYGLTRIGFYIESSFTEFKEMVKNSDIKHTKEFGESDVDVIEAVYEDGVKVEYRSKSLHKEILNRNTPLSDAEKVELLKAEVQRLKEINLELEKEKSSKLQIMADFQNYRKRVEKEKSDFGLMANLDLVNDVLDALDDIKRSLDDDSDDEGMSRQMLTIVRDKLLATVNKVGIELVQVSDGDQYEPSIMEAVGVLTVKSVDDHNKVMKVIQPAYKYQSRDQLLRTAKVIVGKKELKNS